METKEAIAAVIKEDGLDSAIAWIAGVVDEKHNRIEQLEAALQKYSCDCNLDDQDNCEVGCWDSASCGYAARAALGEKKDE